MVEFVQNGKLHLFDKKMTKSTCIFLCFELKYNMNGVLAVSTVLFLPEDGDTCYLQFGGSTYYIDTENLKLVWVM